MGQDTKQTKVYLTEDCWAYSGVYQKIGYLPGINSSNLKLWTMLGALTLELYNNGIHYVTIYNDTRLVEEFNEQVKFEDSFSKNIAVRLKNGIVKKFIKFEVKKLDKHSIDNQMKLP